LDSQDFCLLRDKVNPSRDAGGTQSAQKLIYLIDTAQQLVTLLMVPQQLGSQIVSPRIVRGRRASLNIPEPSAQDCGSSFAISVALIDM
jgi:hypothetical protein